MSNVKGLLALIVLLVSHLTANASSVEHYLKQFHGMPTSYYGQGEAYCGEKIPSPCVKGAVTASGAEFDPNVASVAIAIPKSLRMRPRIIWLKSAWSACTPMLLLDKKNPKHVAKRPWDLSIKAAKVLQVVTGDRIYLCKENPNGN